MPADSPAPSPPPLGLENYQLGAEISTGGMGSVLEARDEKLDRTVAIKVMLLEANADARMRQRFLREAQVLAKLAHPNIVPIYDIVWEDGLPLFYSMKLVKGRTLQAILNDLRKEVPDTLRDYSLVRLLDIFRKVCDAIAFAHSQGVLHRDLKPENIMVGEFGEVLVMDWGLAKRQNDECGMTNDEFTEAEVPISSFVIGNSSSTLHGSVIGTPQYMSPEQARGSASEVDELSDIYALGGILYAILTLRPPVAGTSALEVLEKVLRGEITSPTAFQLRSGSRGKAFEKGEVLEAKFIKPLPHIRGGRMPSALSSVAMKALRLDKANRYPSVTALRADIDAYMTGFATSSEQAGALRQLQLLLLRHKVVTASLAALLIISLGYMMNLRAKERRAAAGEARATIGLADAALRNGNGVRMQDLLHTIPTEMRDSTWQYLLGQSDTSVATIQLDPDGTSSLAPLPRTPSGLAVAQLGGRISFVNVRTGQPLPGFSTGFTPPEHASRPKIAISPDGERIAIGQWGGKGGLSIRQVRDGREILRWEAPETKSLEFNADGSLLLQRCRPVKTPPAIRIWESATGTLLWEETAFGTFSADGRQLIVSHDGLRVVDARDGKTLRRFPGAFPSTIDLAVSRDNLLAAYDNRGVVEIFDLKDLSVVSRFAGAPFRSADYFMAWMPERATLLTAWLTADGRQIVQLQNPRTGAVLRSLLGGRLGISTAAVHPLSGEVVIGLDGLKVWDTLDTPTLMKGRPHAVAFLGFLGSDDVITSYACPDFMPSIKRGSETLWTNKNGDHRFLSVSQNGAVAAISSAGTRWPVLIFKREGEAVRQSHSISTTLNAHKVRLSQSGDEAAVFENKVERYTSDGKPLLALEQVNISRLHEVGWLHAGGRMIGLVSMKGPRFSKTSTEHIILWDTRNGQIIRSVPNPIPANLLAIPHDGHIFAEAGADAMVRLRDAETLAVVREFRAHDSQITALACHPTRRILATGSLDLTVRLWNLDTGELLEELRGPIQPPTQLIFSPSGRLLSCAAATDEARLWEPKALNPPGTK